MDLLLNAIQCHLSLLHENLVITLAFSLTWNCYNCSLKFIYYWIYCSYRRNCWISSIYVGFHSNKYYLLHCTAYSWITAVITIKQLCWHCIYIHKPQTIYFHCFQHMKLCQSLQMMQLSCMSSIFRKCHLWIYNKVTTEGWCAGNMPDMYLRCQIWILAGKATVHGFFLSIQRNASVIPTLGNSCLLP